MQLKGKALSTAVLAAVMGATVASTAFADAQSDATLALQNSNANSTKIEQLNVRVVNLENASSSTSSQVSEGYTQKYSDSGDGIKSTNTVGKNLEALDQKIDGTRDTIWNAHQTDVKNLQGNIDKEAVTRTEADSRLQTGINEAKAADAATRTAMNNGLANEKTLREQADTNLQTNINKNTNLINKVNDNFKTSNELRYNETRENKAAIANETSAREAADTALDQKLGQEIADRKGADAAQDKVINTINDNLVKSVNTINSNIGTITDQLNKNDLAEQQARTAADTTLQNNIDKAVSDQQAINTAQGTVNDNLTKAVQQNSQAIVTTAQAAQNLEKHLGETDGRVDQANQEIHTNAGNIAQLQQDYKTVTDAAKTLGDAQTATNNANAAATNAQNVANNVKHQIEGLQNNVTVTSESDLIKKSQSIGQNVSNVDAALHDEIAKRIGADAAQDKRIQEVNDNAAKGISAVNTALATQVGILNQNDANEAAARDAADKKLAADQQVTSESDLIKKDNTIGQNVTNVDTALHQEIAARIGADAAQDKVIQQVNQNLADNVAALNQQDANEAATRQAADDQEKAAREKADQNLQTNINAETNARVKDRDNLQRNINAETNARVKDRDNLQTNINKNTNAINAVAAVENDHNQRRYAETHKNAADIQAINNHLGTLDADGNYIKKDGTNTVSQNLQALDSQAKTNAENIATNATNIATNTQNISTNSNRINQEINDRTASDSYLQRQIDSNSNSINDLYSRYSSLKTDINKVGARSAALAGLHALDFDPANKFNFAVASGSFRSESSVALGAFYRPNENILLSAASTLGDSDNAYTFGLSFRIGPSSAKTKSTAPDTQELYKVVGELQDQLAAQKEEIEQLKAQKD